MVAPGPGLVAWPVWRRGEKKGRRDCESEAGLQAPGCQGLVARAAKPAGRRACLSACPLGLVDNLSPPPLSRSRSRLPRACGSPRAAGAGPAPQRARPLSGGRRCGCGFHLLEFKGRRACCWICLATCSDRASPKVGLEVADGLSDAGSPSSPLAHTTEQRIHPPQHSLDGAALARLLGACGYVGSAGPVLPVPAELLGDARSQMLRPAPVSGAQRFAAPYAPVNPGSSSRRAKACRCRSGQLRASLVVAAG